MASRTVLRWLAGILVLATFVGLDYSLNRDALRCRQACYGAPATDRYGSSTYEPGHPWTNYATSWQWEAQNTMAHVAFFAACVGLALAATRSRDPRLALVISVAVA